ncbi:ABC transporter ATP-binding protein/permease [Acidimicrobiia bacterium EGI L10123]|uniref:ABC transporter ATP-binding protein n=1 Tax=Salinilacustrithrix flava TaxID=2957203 RepID=UPI003D7C153C|nr:ABC transporter ATP-binding protein/permease [Acidimicrobiia bacterium EGI L10123]
MSGAHARVRHPASANLRRVGPYFAPHRGRMWFVGLSAVVSIAAGLSTPLIAKAVIDGPIARGDKGGIVPWVVLAVVLGLVETGLAHIRRIHLAVAAMDVETNLRNDLYRHLQRLDVGFHDRWQSGQLLSRATSDIATIRRFTAFGAVFLLIISLEVVAIFGLLLSLYWPLAIVAGAFAVPVLVLCARFEAQYTAMVRRIQDETGDMTTEIEEAAKGIGVIKAFGRAHYAFDRYDVHVRRLHASQMERIGLHTKFVWLLGIVPNLILVVTMLAGVLAVGSGDLTLGGLFAFVSYVLILVFPLEALGWILAMAQEAMTAADRVYDVLDTPPVVDDRPGATDLPEVRGHIRFEGVRFAYDAGREVLRGVDLEIAPGETLALVGPTGSGKSTLAMLITRLHDPTAGRVTVDGHDLRDVTLASLRGQVSVAFEEATLFSASVRENLRIGLPGATDADIDAALDVARAGFAHDLPWGLDTRIGEQGMTLSGGQRQRLALARAVIARPRILVLDDPLSALDVHTEAEVEHRLRPLLADRTALVVVHRPSTIALADRAALLVDGLIVATGTHTELLATEPRYREILAQAADDEEGVRA